MQPLPLGITPRKLRHTFASILLPRAQGALSDAPVQLGVDGKKMSKSRNNAIAIAASADETAWLLRRAKTDSDQDITYEPETRPEVGDLSLLVSARLFPRPGRR